MDLVDKPLSEDDERKMKNLATRIMNNGVEVLVKDKSTDSKQDQTKYMELKTIQPSIPSQMYMSNYPKIDKRVDSDENDGFELIQPSESANPPCTTSCSCSHTKTEGLKTRYSNPHDHTITPSKYNMKTSKYGTSKFDVRPTKVNLHDKKTQHRPYEYEDSQLAPTDRIVEKYTEVINDYSDEKDSHSVEQSELLTNEQAPTPPPKNNKVSTNKPLEKTKPEKPQKPNKNKVLVADLLKLGSLGIKGLSQLAPVIEKMTGGFIKRQDTNRTSTTTTTPKSQVHLTPYHVNKRVDSELESKQSNFPIYIPVDELETSESQIVFTNATLHQNMAWAAEHKQAKARIVPPKMVHESPLVNGGIPISPGEIITANSDVIVGKPAVGGPLTLAASGIKLHNPVNPPPLDSFVAGNEQYVTKEKPPVPEQMNMNMNINDDSFDLRPPQLPKSTTSPIRNHPSPSPRPSFVPHSQANKMHRLPPPLVHSEQMMKTQHMKTNNPIMSNHGRPAFLDYIPSLGKPNVSKHRIELKPVNEDSSEESDNSPSSSEIVNTRVTPDGHATSSNVHKPFLVDIQPSKVANVLIPHGSATALVFAGSSEPHKTGEYIDDPLPYPEPGYFGSFSIDAPQMTNVHNVALNNKPFSPKPSPPLDNYKQNTPMSYKDQPFRNDFKLKWKENKRPTDFKIPPPTSNQETHLQVGPHITAYNPDVYRPNNGDFEKYKPNRNTNKYKDGKEVIDKEYENYLAVPPPPPGMHYHKESHHDNKNQPYNQRPIVHTKPVQDMKVFLNIQHPVSKPPSETPPPKVTSEIYYAAQAPNSHPTPTYTIQMPPSPPPYASTHVYNTLSHQAAPSSNVGTYSNSFTVVSSPDFTNKSIHPNDLNNDNTYSVTLNTATNVASNIGETGQVIGSSIPVAIGSSADNTDIPIGTNFAIRVQDSSVENNGQNRQPTTVYNDQTYEHEGKVKDNRWNSSMSENIRQTFESSTKKHYYDHGYSERPVQKEVSIAPSLNSHANFPIMSESNISPNSYEDIRPVTEEVDDIKNTDQKRPAKLIPNIPTNSHGWYSSVLQNENNLNSIKLEVTTRKIIPLIHEYNRDSVPDFGQKITSVGKPPSEFWAQKPNLPEPNNKQNIGKPFTRSQTTEKPHSTTSYTSKPHHSNYIPSYLGGMKQPAYDIPIRDNSDETTTSKSSEKLKPVYENSEEIYDGEEEFDNNGENDGEVSQESVKVPVVSTSEEKYTHLKSTTESIKLNDKNFSHNENVKEKIENVKFIDYPGTQTEKPFEPSNKTKFTSNTIKPIYDDVNLKPRPFNVNIPSVLDHQLQQPHWQINHLAVNSTNNMSYEDGFELNIGEEMGTSSSPKPLSTQTSHKEPDTKYTRRPQRPIFSYQDKNKRNDSIITSTIHINDKKPLVVEDGSKSTLSPISLTTIDLNRSSSEIIDLSPPPPTIDYSFKPSANDELIMGMSPPPPRISLPPRLPQRPPHTPRPVPPYKPPRTLPPRTTTQRPVRRPINKDEVSTYRPTYDILHNIRKPVFNKEQPSSQLLPPPRNIPSKPVNEGPTPTANIHSIPNVVFPTPISSGWLTSSGIEFSSSFDFGPSSVQFPKVEKSREPTPSEAPQTENPYPYDMPSSSEQISESSTEKENKKTFSTSKEISSESSTIKVSSEEQNLSDSAGSESSQENTSTEKIRVPIGSKYNRTRKPYPIIRHDDKKSTTSKYRPTRPTTSPKPPRIHPDILYPSRVVPSKRPTKPLPSRTPSISSIIEGSEVSIDDDFVKPTEVLKDSITPTPVLPEKTSLVEKLPASVTPSLDDVIPNVKPTHHAGNEVEISDEIAPTKTEFKTTVITFTKTLSEPPRIVSSIGYVNLTHTLTVTHTMTSLVSKSEGAVTQTLVLTNTHTSTIVDVVTEVHTQVQPTTIIETVTKHIPLPSVEPTPVQEVPAKTKTRLDDLTMSSEEENLIIKDETTENIQKIHTEPEGDNDTFFIVLNKSQNGGKAPPIQTEIETGDYAITRDEQDGGNGVSKVLFGDILIAGTPFLDTSVVAPGVTYLKECQPDCKASRNERCQRIDGMMKCVCRPGFARMFPDRPCKPTYTYSVKLALGSQGNERLKFHGSLADNSSKQYHALAIATHEGINRMVMQSDLRDVYHGVHITGFHPVEMRTDGDSYQGVINDFYVQLSDNAHESRLKEVIEKYLRNNNYSLGGTDVYAAGELVEKLEVSDFDECTSGQFHDCSEHAQCFNLRGTYTCSCREGFADLSVNTLYPGRICSAEPVGCERCNYHGTCYSRDDQRVLCECFQWYAGSSCHINLKVVLISLVVLGALLTMVLVTCAIIACRRPRPPPRSIVTCIQSMPSLHQSALPKQRADRRALISDRTDSGDASSLQNASLPYMPAKRSSTTKKCMISDPPSHDPPPPPAPAVMIPRARLHPHHDSRENISRKKSLELSSEEKLISYLESGAVSTNEEMRRKHSMESSYSANKNRQNKQGALVSAGFKVSTQVRAEEAINNDRDDMSSINKNDIEAELRFDSLRKSYSQDDMSEWTDAERRIGELTLSEARSVGGTLPASTGRAASSTRLTHQEAHTMAERDLGSTFLLPHVHLYKPDLTSDVSEFDSL